MTFLGLACLPAAAGDDQALVAFKAAIAEKYKLKVDAFARADFEAITSKFYSEDATSASPANDGAKPNVHIGRDQTRKFYKELMETEGPVKVVIKSEKTFVAGDAGWDWATFSVMPEGKPQFDFLILFLWAKEKGEWICKGDMYFTGKFPAS
jgi:hypothetical protein